ncbi:MAG: aminotransferase class IV [Planctomycetota bacterium]
MTIWIDGELQGGSTVPRSKAIAPFETMGAHDGDVPLWSRHLDRLVGTARRLGLPFAPTPELRAAAAEVLLKNGHADDVLRLSLVPDDDASAGPVRVVLSSRARSPIRTVKLLPTIVERPHDAPPGDVKAEPRRFYDQVRQQAQDGEADDGIVVGLDGAVLEAALGNLWLRLDGVWVTPPLDGRVLPGIARQLLLERARDAGLRCEERAVTLADLHRADAIAHSNAVYGPRPACLLGELAAVEIVDSGLGALWRQATAG